MRILVAVVTHNRRELLARCIDFISRQTRPADGLLIINNDSTDGTVELLTELGVPFVTQENVGSAGGWHTGIQYAIEQAYSAVWLMDDDGYPDPQSLELLERAMLPGIACASSVVIREDDPARFVFPFPVLDAKGLPRLVGRRRKIKMLDELKVQSESGLYQFAHLFNGALISINAVHQIGNVNRDFFMFGDEVDYFFRLRSAGKVISVLTALHYHPDVSLRPYTPAKVYYYLKNTLILNQTYFNAVWFRHAAAIAAVLGRTASRNGSRTALSLIAGTSAKVFYSAILRGLRGQIGKDFND